MRGPADSNCGVTGCSTSSSASVFDGPGSAGGRGIGTVISGRRATPSGDQLRPEFFGRFGLCDAAFATHQALGKQLRGDDIAGMGGALQQLQAQRLVVLARLAAEVVAAARSAGG